VRLAASWIRSARRVRASATVTAATSPN
jgi:hypothetical protein